MTAQVTPWGTVIRPACEACYRPWYEHHDHAHDDLVAIHGRCPFGDCGNWRAAQGKESRDGV